MTRREWMAMGMGAAAMRGLGAPPRTEMGIAWTCYMTVWRPHDTLEFLEHCHGLGAAGIQTNLASTDAGYLKQLRAKIEQYGMYLEVMGPMPKASGGEYEAVSKAAKEAGALCIRSACLGGRRYENFKTLTDWTAFVRESEASIERAVAIAERVKMPLALENHKDWTAEEFASILKQFPSEYFGVCLDTGNNMALLDDPMEVVEVLAPRAISTHLKDMNVAEYRDGFLLSEVPLGEGMLDLKKIVATVRRHRPKTKLTLEMITRNPLRVPCLTDGYWATFPERNGKYLARTLRMVERRKGSLPLPTMTGLDAGAQRRYEDDNVKQCLHVARTQLLV